MNIKSIFTSFVMCLTLVLSMSCSKDSEVEDVKKYFQMVPVQDNTCVVLWDPSVYNFKVANKYYLDYFRKKEQEKKKQEQELNQSSACTSWRNGNFHGRNLDWYQANYGCIVIKMPKGNGVKYASVGTINSSTIVTQDFVNAGVLSNEMRQVLPAATTDGINEAGVAININIVPHQPGDPYKGYREDALCSNAVVRYVLDNAGSVGEAIKLIDKEYVCQSIVNLAGDESHYMISNKDTTAVVEFPQGEMKVTYFKKTDKGWYSENNNPAIMTNFYDYAAEQYGVGTEAFYDYHPTAMGVERWLTVKDQYDNAKNSVESNLVIAKSVWYYKGLIKEKKLWYTDNAVPESAYGKDAYGWYYFNKKELIRVANAQEAMKGYWDANMQQYWADYENKYGILNDPHVKDNKYWETSHTVIYDIANKKGYLYPFENFYNKEGKAIDLLLP